MGRTTVYNNIVSDEVLQNINKKNLTLMDDFLDYLVSVDRSKTTIEAYRHDLQIFFCWNCTDNENKYFIDLTKREIARFQKHALSEWGWSSNRLSRVKSTLSSMSNYIENILDEEEPDFRPIVRKIESPIKAPVREKTVISNTEVDNILDALVLQGKFQLACLFALAAFSGARKTELLRFKVSYFDKENIMSDAALYRTPETIVTKGRGSAGKKLIKYTLLDFKQYYDLWMNERERRGLKSEYLFVNANDEVCSVGMLNNYAETISELLGRPFYWHSLRHQLCTRLVKIGLPADVIKDYFGWNNVSMLSIYSDIDGSDSFGDYFTKDGIVGSNAKL